MHPWGLSIPKGLTIKIRFQDRTWLQALFKELALLPSSGVSDGSGLQTWIMWTCLEIPCPSEGYSSHALWRYTVQGADHVGC